MNRITYFVLLLFSLSAKAQIQSLSFPDTANLSPQQAEIWQLWKNTSPPRPLGEMHPIETAYFVKGDPTEGLHTPFSNKPKNDSLVQLPHRVNYPDCPLWYTTQLYISDTAVLYVNADDGAQVYLGETFLKQWEPYHWLLPPASDSQTVTIRVLNNALAGGLRRAFWLPKTQYEAFLRKQEVYEKRKELALLAVNFPLSEQEASSIKTALQQPTTENLQLANSIFAEKCYFKIAPFVQQVDEVYQLRFELNKPASMQLQYGFASNALNFSENLSEPYFDFQNLPLDTTIFYQLSQNGESSSVYHFRTTKTTVPFSFTAWGDSQGGWETFTQVSKDMAQQKPDLSIGLGDLVSNGSNPAQWYDFLRCLQPLTAKTLLYPVPGNHDYDGYYDDLYAHLYHEQIRDDNYFSWTYGNAFFVALDPNERFPIGIENEQLAWFEEQMQSEAWQKADWHFILLHQPPYSQGWPGYHGDVFIRELVEKYAESAEIDFVLSGHSHDYERLTKPYGEQKVHYLILGGAGGGLEPPENSDFPKMDKIIKQHHYGLFEVEQEQIKLQIIGLEKRVLDEVVFTKK